MTDYGHELKFGTFITPNASQADAVVALAQLTEAAGLDLATFQDHPYQSSFLDTWTLLSFVAAKTERISLSGNVLNLPLRQPAVLARAVASLDLLSHGRAELGLGAGAFWDGIKGMGGPELTPGHLPAHVRRPAAPRPARLRGRRGRQARPPARASDRHLARRL